MCALGHAATRPVGRAERSASHAHVRNPATLATTATPLLRPAQRRCRPGRPVRSTARATAHRTATCPAAYVCVFRAMENPARPRLPAARQGPTAQTSGAPPPAAPTFPSGVPAARRRACRSPIATDRAPAWHERPAGPAAQSERSVRRTSSAWPAAAPRPRSKEAHAGPVLTVEATSPAIGWCARASRTRESARRASHVLVTR